MHSEVREMGWELIGGDPAPGDPAAIAGLALELLSTADNAKDVRDRLVRLEDGATDAIWRGDTADAFRDRIDKMPEHLQKLDRSYRKASEGLDAYSRELRDLKADAEAALTKAGDAAQEAGTARQQQRQFAETNTDPAATNPHDEAVSGADQRLRQAIDEANDIRGRKRSAEDRVLASLDEASDLGIKNDPWWRKALRAISTALKIIGLVLLVIAIVVIIVIALTTPGGFLAILAALQACAFLGTLGTAMTVVGIAAFATAATQYATGDDTVGLGDVALAGVFAFGPLAFAKGLGYLSNAMRGGRAVPGLLGAGDNVVRGADDVAGVADDVVRAGDDVVGAAPAGAAAAPAIVVKPGKWDYFFGRVTSNPHNQARSVQNLRDLEALGIRESEGGQAQLAALFEQGRSLPETARHTTEFGVTITRRIPVGDKGVIDAKYFYPGGDLSATPEISTIIPKIFK